MKYFRIQHSTNLKEIGKFSQCDNGIFVSTWNSPNSLLSFFMKKADNENLEVPEFYIDRKAKVTDLLSVSFVSFKLVISTKVKNLIEEFKYDGIQFFRSALHSDSEVVNKEYWILNPYGFRNEFIHFPLSTIECRLKVDISYHEVNDIVEFNQFMEDSKKESKICVIDKLTLNKAKINEEFFLLQGVSGGIGYFVSENLKNKMIKAGCSGIEFEEIPTV